MANKANSVKKYIVAEDGTLVQKGYYLEAALSWERITDEDNNVTDIYTNLLGQKVFERHVMTQGMVDTYFVYNDCSKLCYVLQPMYQQEEDLDKFAFQYRYDNRGRMVEKTITGCEKITYTYDSRPYTHHAGRRDAQEGIVKALYLRRFGAHKFPNVLSGKCHSRHRAKELLRRRLQPYKRQWQYSCCGSKEHACLLWSHGRNKLEYDNFGYTKVVYFKNGSSIEYVHTSDGEKLKETYTTSVPNITKPVGLPFSLAPPEIQSVITKDYWGTDIICKNGTPQQFFFDGGFANIKDNELSWHYYVKDHLGSNRIVQDEKGKVEASYNFYPFGGSFEHCQELYTNNISQPFTYQGKEKVNMYGFGMLDFGARFHAPLLGRWTSVDQLSEKYYSWSPYVFCLNNPIRNTDTDGRIVETGWDAANVAMDATSFIANAATGNYWSAAVDGAAMIYDVAATAVPGLPGGAGAALKMYRASKVVHTAQTTQTVFRATKNNYRSVLQKVTGKVGKGYEAHHTLPQKYRIQFEKLGINIDKPGNVVWREANGHRKKSNALTIDWDIFMHENKTSLTKEKVFQFRDKMEKKHFGNKFDTPIK